MRRIVIGLLGAGNVGSGVVRILQDHDDIERRLGAQVVVKKLLVRDPARARAVDLPAQMLTTDPEEILGDSEIRMVVELIGGIEPARSYVLEALARGKHVVTANKALMAAHGKELFAEAAKRGVAINFEASVAGGIPILRSLREGLASDKINRITGIVNGTCNFILDAMSRTGMAYEEALVKAQEAGFAEADPTLDVGGGDAAQKLCLLTLLAFGVRIDPAKVPTDGITRVRPFDIETARKLGYVLKSLAIASQPPESNGPLTLRVHTAFVPKHSVLAGVHGPYNAVLVDSNALGRSLFYGQGAGSMPTGMAVVSDIIELCRSVIAFDSGRAPPEAFSRVHEHDPAPLDALTHENYLCVHVQNVPGILGRVATCLGEHGVSVKQVEQHFSGHDDPVEMVIITEAARDSSVSAAVAAVDALGGVLEPTHRFRICEPDPLEPT